MGRQDRMGGGISTSNSTAIKRVFTMEKGRSEKGEGRLRHEDVFLSK